MEPTNQIVTKRIKVIKRYEIVEETEFEIKFNPAGDKSLYRTVEDFLSDDNEIEYSEVDSDLIDRKLAELDDDGNEIEINPDASEYEWLSDEHPEEGETA